MESYTGKSIFQKVAVGRIFYYEKMKTLLRGIVLRKQRER